MGVDESEFVEFQDVRSPAPRVGVRERERLQAALCSCAKVVSPQCTLTRSRPGDALQCGGRGRLGQRRNAHAHEHCHRLDGVWSGRNLQLDMSELASRLPWSCVRRGGNRRPTSRCAHGLSPPRREHGLRARPATGRPRATCRKAGRLGASPRTRSHRALQEVAPSTSWLQRMQQNNPTTRSESLAVLSYPTAAKAGSSERLAAFAKFAVRAAAVWQLASRLSLACRGGQSRTRSTAASAGWLRLLLHSRRSPTSSLGASANALTRSLWIHN